MSLVVVFAIALFAVVLGLSPTELRAALVAGGVPSETLAANFTCVNAFQFGQSRYGCRNGNVVVSLSLDIDVNLTSLVLPDLDCLGVTTQQLGSIDTTIFISCRTLTSLTVGAIRNCHKVLIGNNAMSTLALGVLTNVTELKLLGNPSLRGNLSLVARDAPGFASTLSFSSNGNLTNRFSVAFATNASIKAASFDDNAGLTSLHLDAAAISDISCNRNALITTLSLPSLVNASALVATRCGSLTSISAPQLKLLDDRGLGLLDVEHNSELTTLDIPLLSVAKQVLFVNNSGLTSLFLPALSRSTQVRVRFNAGLTSVALSGLVNATTALELDANLKLTQLDVSSLANSTVTIKSSPLLTALSFPAIRKPSTLRITNCSALASIAFGASADLRTFTANDNPALASVVWPAQAAFDSLDLARCAFVGAVPANLPTASVCTLQRANDTNCFDCAGSRAANCTCVECSRLGVTTSVGASTTTTQTTTTTTTSTTGTTTGAATGTTTGTTTGTATGTATGTTTGTSTTTVVPGSSTTESAAATTTANSATTATLDATNETTSTTDIVDVTTTASAGATSIATVVIAIVAFQSFL